MKLALTSILLSALTSAQDFSLPAARKFSETYCVRCHEGTKPSAGLDLKRFRTVDSILEEKPLWIRLAARVRSGEMPPKGLPSPSPELRESFINWVDHTLRTATCAAGPVAGPSPVRRLNRNEYANTIRDLLNIHINAGAGLPSDGAGGEGFDNAAETLFLSPIHAEKYLEAARQALEYAMSDPRSSATFLIAQPKDGVTPVDAARKVIAAFVPRAFRRPAATGEEDRYVALFSAAQARGDSYETALVYALSGVLVSPKFLFRVEQSNPRSDYALASRLSYFLWETTPDKTLLDLASEGKLQETSVLNEQVDRMLKDVKAREFAEHFVEQWLGTRELGRDIKPDPKLFADYYDAELQAAIKYEPVLFFQEILSQNHSLLALLDSNFTILTAKLARHYGLPRLGLNQQPKRATLIEDSHRGGLLGMAAVLAVSSYPNRTSPVLRGKWVLEAILGTPPPPPPPNVPTLKENHPGAPELTLRERLTQHRADPSCAVCHNRIDPIGFGLENYDVLGRWRTEESGKTLDVRGELPNGAIFKGPEQLKEILLSQKDLFLRNLTNKMLGYALGRSLTLNDQCTVDRILGALSQTNYSSNTLIKEIVLSAPFRAPTAAAAAASRDNRKGD